MKYAANTGKQSLFLDKCVSSGYVIETHTVPSIFYFRTSVSSISLMTLLNVSRIIYVMNILFMA